MASAAVPSRAPLKITGNSRYFVVTGETYKHRAALREMGGWWKALDKGWGFRGGARSAVEAFIRKITPKSLEEITQSHPRYKRWTSEQGCRCNSTWVCYACQFHCCEKAEQQFCVCRYAYKCAVHLPDPHDSYRCCGGTHD